MTMEECFLIKNYKFIDINGLQMKTECFEVPMK